MDIANTSTIIAVPRSRDCFGGFSIHANFWPQSIFLFISVNKGCCLWCLEWNFNNLRLEHSCQNFSLGTCPMKSFKSLRNAGKNFCSDDLLSANDLFSQFPLLCRWLSLRSSSNLFPHCDCFKMEASYRYEAVGKVNFLFSLSLVQKVWKWGEDVSSVSQLAAAEALTASTFLWGEGRSEVCLRWRRRGRSLCVWSVALKEPWR